MTGDLAVPPGCLATCQAGRHKYDGAHPFPHAAELSQAGRMPEPVSHPGPPPTAVSQGADPATEDMPRVVSTVPREVARKRILVEADTVPQLAETAVSILEPEEHGEFLDGVLRAMHLPALRRGLPAPPPGFVWATAKNPALSDAKGLAHLVSARDRWTPGLDAWCGLSSPGWADVPVHDRPTAVPCPICLDPRGPRRDPWRNT